MASYRTNITINEWEGDRARCLLERDLVAAQHCERAAPLAGHRHRHSGLLRHNAAEPDV